MKVPAVLVWILHFRVARAGLVAAESPSVSRNASWNTARTPSRVLERLQGFRRVTLSSGQIHMADMVIIEA